MERIVDFIWFSFHEFRVILYVSVKVNSLTLTMFFRRFVVLNVIKRQIYIGLAKKVFFFLMSSFRTFLFFKSCIWCTEYVLFVYEMEDEAEHQHLILFCTTEKEKSSTEMCIKVCHAYVECQKWFHILWEKFFNERCFLLRLAEWKM